jgi:8-oxo-dGTP diphosphatase
VSKRSLIQAVIGVAYDLVMKLNPRKLGAHAAIFDETGRVLVVRSRYNGLWQLPGGGVDRGEHLDTAVRRECREELGVEVAVDGLAGLHYHGDSATYVAIFRCRILSGSIRLSHEHAAWRWAPPEELPPRLREQVADARDRTAGAVLRTYV